MSRTNTNSVSLWTCLLASAVCASTQFACESQAPAALDAPDAPAFEERTHILRYGPQLVAPGEEGTRCIWLRLDNDAPIKVRAVHNKLNSSSHHLIVYKDDQDTVEQLTPERCTPFAGALNPTGRIAPIVITQKSDDRLELPPRVAYTLDAHQMIKLEMHYLNSTDAPIEATATVEFVTADEDEIDHEADILFIGSPDINIPAGATQTLKQFFTVPSELDLSASNVFAITGHTHHFGTDMNVRVGASKTDPAMRKLYDPAPFLWSEPETTLLEPPTNVPRGGGFEFECTWTNTSNQRVEFGESANDEMCFFWAYYYPSQGSKVCVHTDQVGGVNGLDVCCPGDALCGLIEDYFEN